jgi:prephenate dehydrogenase
MTQVDLGRVAVIGVGLIGGSVALALRAAGACSEVIGVGREPDNMRAALELGVVDRVAATAAGAVAGARLVVIATPMAQFESCFAEIRDSLSPDTLVIDVGSTKREAVRAAHAGLRERLAQFVPSHPVAGAERSGAAAARADLFRGRRVVVTPLAENRPETVRLCIQIWEACGARVSSMTPEAHDEILGAVSHLPHVLAYALVHEFAMRGNAGELFGLAGGGFRDFTRIASSHPEMWRDICVVNRDAISSELTRYVAKLGTLRALIDAGDGAALEALFAEAKTARDHWLDAVVRESGR